MKRLLGPIIIIVLLIVLIFSLQPTQAMAKVISWISNSSIFSNTIVGTTAPSLPSPTPSDRTVGLFYNDPRAWVGYTLMAPKQSHDTYLINNKGQFVHKWSSSYTPGQSAYLESNGNLIRAASMPNPDVDTGGGDGGRIEEYDWSGNLTWSVNWSTTTYVQHHDFVPMPNGNVMMLVAEKYTYDQAVAAGFNPSHLNAVSNKTYILPDSIIEVNRSGAVVWEWHVWDHLIQDYDNTKLNCGVVKDHPELIDVNGGNTSNNTVAVFWNHFNAITYNPSLDQVMVSCRSNSEIWIIDHSTTSAQSAGHSGGNNGRGGDLIYRWGNPAQYEVPGAQQSLFQQHCGMWIPDNYPGAGHILIFNNGIGRGYTSTDEVITPLDANDNYTLTTGAAYGPTSAVWSYEAKPPTSFYSDEISSVQRLPNGNNLICSGVNGTLFEVTAGGKIVWKYVNPIADINTILNYNGAIPTDPNKPTQLKNEVFRVLRYAPDYPGLVGKTLTSLGNIETGP